ncbi:MAG: DUF4886 domain-containing protein [Bacteroidales bacterium]|nr:DUF4886 domain-containing protein [Bacteroidales bacterium]
MRKLLSILLLLPLLCSCSRPDVPVHDDPVIPDNPTPDPPAPTPPDTLRILAIGNSFSSDAVEQNLWELFYEAGIPAVIGNVYAPGSYLVHHWKRAVADSPEYRYFKRTDKGSATLENQTLLQGVKDEPWDFISLQQASDLSGLYDTYFPYLPDLMTWIGERSDAEIVFHQTWAYPANSTHEAFANYGNDQQTMYEAIMDAVKRATEECDIRIVIPVGTAVQNARLVLGDKLNRDGLHLELTYGRFLAACVWYETFSGKDVRENPYRPSSVSEDIANICREAAHQACLKPYEVTPIK